MDVANVRLVAILAGRGERGRLRGLVARSAVIAAAVSAGFAALVLLGAGWLASLNPLPAIARPAYQAAALGIPLAALAFTYMGATRGLKVMRYTLYGQWVGQPVTWILLMLAGWTVAGTAGMSSLAFSVSWGLALVVAWLGWRKLTAQDLDAPRGHGIPEERTGALVRFGALRAPATLFSQLIFFTDMYVMQILWRNEAVRGGIEVGIYNAALNVGQSLFLFLTSVSLTFSPFVADLHHRGERDRLDGLYKTVTRWTLAATIPLLLVLAILPGHVLRIFGAAYPAGAGSLRILIVGMIVPVMVGTVGFILIMVGRTGWDLFVYFGGFAIDIGVAAVLAGPDALGMEGAAIAQALTLTFSAIARLLLVRRFVRIWPFNRQYLRLVAPTLAGAAVMWGVHVTLAASGWLMNLVASSAAGFLAYAAVLLAAGLTPTERDTLRRLVARLRPADRTS
jgi:O-antigen/teichoic acid export membrane protein